MRSDRARSSSRTSGPVDETVDTDLDDLNDSHDVDDSRIDDDSDINNTDLNDNDLNDNEGNDNARSTADGDVEDVTADGRASRSARRTAATAAESVKAGVAGAKSGVAAARSGVAAARSGAAATASIPATLIEAVRSLLARPLASYQLILTMAFLMTAFGLVMVLSASSVEGYSKEGSSYGLFATQMIFALLGLVGFYFMLRLPVRLLRRFAAPTMFIAVILLVLVLIPGIGTLSQGARRWFVIYGLSVQPSELVKVTLCVWGAHLLASRRRDNASLRELLIPLIPVAMLVCLLIVLEPNLSTTITIAIIVGALLWFAGLPIKVFAAFAVSGISVAVFLALAAGYRSQRVMSFLGSIDDPQGAGYQARQATFALANGGVFGVGLGQSSAKWNYLPNAHNDFIFAIIGEELGLLGGLMVVLLFVLLAYIGFRIAQRSVDPFLRLMAAAITTLITAQAFINIGYVVGLLPVTGIQLPLISAGGTSTLTVLAMLGLLANAARHEPEAVAALTTGPRNRLPRWLRLPPPVAYRRSRVESLRDRLDQRRAGGPAGGTRVPAGGRATRRPSSGRAQSGRAQSGRTPAGRTPSPAPSTGRATGRFAMPWKRRARAAERTEPTRTTGGRGRTRAAAPARPRVDYGVGYPAGTRQPRSSSPGWRAGSHQPRTTSRTDPGRGGRVHGTARRR